MGHRLPADRKAWQPYLVMAILNNLIPFSLIVTGQKVVASGLASVLNATTPVFTLILAHYLTADDKLRANKLVGVIIGLAGVALLVGPEALTGQTSNLLGMFCLLGATVSYSFAGLWGRRLKDSPPLVTAASQLICSTAMLIPLAGFVDQPWQLPAPSAEVVIAMFLFASLSTALAYILFFRILAVSGASNVQLVTLLVPLTAIPLGIWWLGEMLLPRHLAGAFVIGASLLVIDGRLVRWLTRTKG
jgi:drug/metabolite transporter (DMT)-like permease